MNLDRIMRIALIGAGTMGTVHARSWAGIAGAELVAVHDPRAEAASALAARFGGRYCTDWASLLATGPEVADICVPTDLHRDYAVRAAAAGLHVIVEKPIALNLADAHAMAEACAGAGVGLYVAHVVRFFPEYVRARQAVAVGELGRVGIVRTFRGGGFPRGSDDWFGGPARSGGLILDLLIHDLDWLRWTLGPVARAFARALPRHALATLRFASGAMADLEGTWAYPAGFGTAFEIAGSEGILSHRSDRSAPLRIQGDPASGGVPVPVPSVAQSPYARELAHFHACLRGEAEPVVTAADAIAALELALAVRRSAETGLPEVV